MELQSEIVNIKECLRSVVRLYFAAARTKSLQLECHVADDLPDNLIVDPLRFRQILSNLIGNAIKFTDRGLFVLNAKRITEDGFDKLLVEISDSGKGVTNSEKNRIFDAFTQANCSIYKPDSGTRLGLGL